MQLETEIYHTELYVHVISREFIKIVSEINHCFIYSTYLDLFRFHLIITLNLKYFINIRQKYQILIW